MIEIKNVTKKFNDFTAVNDLSLTIKTGEFFGLLGPNGAGKTTTIGMLSTILLPSNGEILIDGKPLTRKASDEKARISLVTQEYSMRQDMTVWEVMEYHGRLYKMPRALRKEKATELLKYYDLFDVKHRTVRYLSGGMKRKLMICRALMTDPDILMLDEPTAGMDAFSRRQMWSLLKKLNRDDLTILLTTHYMEEAEELCERVALINKGTLDRVDSPGALIEELGGFCVTYVDRESESESFGQHSYEKEYSRYFKTREEAIEFLSGKGKEAILRNTTLEDVFIERVGAKLGK